MHESPSQVLANVSEAVAARGYGRFCTAVYGHLRPSAEGTTLTVAAGGHPPPIVLRADGSAEVVSVHGPLLGVLAEPRFTAAELTLEPGDALVLYTDGLTERNPRVDAEEGLLRIVGALSGETADELLSELEQTALGPHPRRPRDDVAILIVKQPRAQ